MTTCRLPLIAAACGIFTFLCACSEAPTPDPRLSAPLVRAVVVHANGAYERSFTGVVGARVQSDLGFRVAGKVVERMVDNGQKVKRGQILMRIDATDLDLALRAQVEAVAAAQAQARQSAAEEARYRSLRGTGAISASAYDQVKSMADAAAARLQSAQAQAATARNATGYARLVADADGIVTETLAEPGQVVAAGQTVVRVAHAGPREAIVQLPETMRPVIGSSASATLFGLNAAVPATLRQLSNSADPATRTFEARYVLNSTLAAAPLGGTVTIRMAQAAVSAAGVSVPLAAIYDAGQGPGVWLIQERSRQVNWRPLAIVRIGDDSASVQGSIPPGARIVALGVHLLREGQQVRILGEQAAAPRVSAAAGAPTEATR
jgi:RND family efflux transporter MFP subunit